MANADSNSAEHPLANPGYGKRSTPYERPAGPDDWGHLPPREAAIAAYIDRLPDGSDISVKMLAEKLPYGQCAVRTALNRIQRVGHLRRGRECLHGLWITRTWWSRSARDDAWWTAFERGDVPKEKPRPTRSRAYILLAALGRENSVLSLSHAECHTLSPLVEEWFAREATDDDVRRALTTGLPSPVHHPAALLRTRLTTKIPPEPLRREPPPLRLLECAKCGAPSYAETLAGGECGTCRGEPAPPPRPAPAVPAPRVHAYAEAIRARERNRP
ncbi:hypothetical protein AB0C77_11630 [Streptomyces sp. NPDC048629]|uniref:hypothetical protein n=1 Tax=Streptomyces sp. NPDC048629 TaxID=3154824 RepID=UPI003415E46F